MKTAAIAGPALATVITGVGLTGVGCTNTSMVPPEPPASRPQATAVDTSIAAPQIALPSPDAPTTPPAGAVTAADLPSEQDLVWSPQARWIAGTTTSGGGTEQLSVCQQNRLESLGANSLQTRAFTLTSGGTATAIAMSYDSTAVADQAYATVQEWVDDCTEVLQAQGRRDGRKTVPVTTISLEGGRAQMSEWAYAAGNAGQVESQGLFQVGERVGVLVMRIEGQDSNWDLSPGGPVGMVHPMIRSVPPAAQKLAR